VYFSDDSSHSKRGHGAHFIKNSIFAHLFARVFGRESTRADTHPQLTAINTLQQTATHCSTLPHTAIHVCGHAPSFQHTATHFFRKGKEEAVNGSFRGQPPPEGEDWTCWIRTALARVIRRCLHRNVAATALWACVDLRVILCRMKGHNRRPRWVG